MVAHRRRRLTTSAVAAGALCCAVPASAIPLHFENPADGEPGHADWFELGFLNITRPASQQDGVNREGAFQFRIDVTFDPFTDPQEVRNGVITGGFGGRIHGGGSSPSTPAR